jgi:dimethylaniline monooxygenase (N-oxide forming)
MPFYRLVGPFRDEKAPEIVRTELWETITRRGIPGLVLGSLLPMAFYGIVNICAWVLEAALRPVGLVSMS